MAGSTDIRQLLPATVYQAAVNANAPTLANPFATMADLSGLGGESLSATLAIGNTMLNTDTIKSVNGKSSFATVDTYVGVSFGVIGVDVVSSLDLSPGQAQLFLINAGLTKFSNLGLYDNTALVNFAPGATDQFPGKMSSRGGSFAAGVVNAVSVGGRDIKLKTNDTTYLNAIGFNTGLAGEMRLVHTPNAADFVATLKAETGTIAYLTDIPAGAGNNIYNIDGNINAPRTATFVSGASPDLTFRILGAGIGTQPYYNLLQLVPNNGTYSGMVANSNVPFRSDNGNSITAKTRWSQLDKDGLYSQDDTANNNAFFAGQDVTTGLGKIQSYATGFTNSTTIDFTNPTGVNVQTIQDASGTIALTTDITTPSLRNVSATDTFATANETINCTANTFTVNLPTAVGIQGTTYILVNSGTGTITLDGNGTETINGSLTIDLTQYTSRTVQSDGTNWIII